MKSTRQRAMPLRFSLLPLLTLAVGNGLALADAAEGRQSAVGAVNNLTNVTDAKRAKSPLADFERYIEQARAELGNVGVAVAVVQNDQVLFARGFGIRESGKSAKIGPDTLFQIGSTTKAFTPAALGILVDEGKIRWDDPVVDHLPEFQLQDPWLTQNLTVRDTVTHRSGIVGSPYFVLAVMDADEAMRQLRYVTPEAAFRDSYRYSNVMYGVAGKIIAAASGMSWHEFVRRRLLQPLKMKRSGTSPYEFWDAKYVTPTFQGMALAGRYSHRDARDADVAMPHLTDEQGSAHVIAWQSYDNAAAAGSIVSSANDMANWLVLNLNEGRFAGKQVLKPETMKELHAVQNVRYDSGKFPFEGAMEGYAMGWNKIRYHDHSLLAHGGGIIGFPAYVAMMPEQKIGVVVLSNSEQAVAGDNQAFRKAIALRAFDQLLNVPLREWHHEFQARAKQAGADAKAQEEELQRSRLRNAPLSLPLDQYVGDYEDRRLHSGRVKVRLEGGQLALSFAGEGAYTAFLEHWHRDTFRLRKKGPGGRPWGFLSFVIDPVGKVVAVSMFDSTFNRLSVEGTP